LAWVVLGAFALAIPSAASQASSGGVEIERYESVAEPESPE